MTESEAAEFYDEMWQRYGHLDASSPAAFHRRRLIVELCRRHAPDARRVLDAGAGRGELLQALGRAFPRAALCASDVSRASVEETRRVNPTFEALQMDLAAPEFEQAFSALQGRFDLVTCSEVIEHIPDDHLAVRRVASLLAPGGTLVITVPSGKMSRFDELIGHQRHYREPALRALAEHAELEVLELWAWGFPFQNLYRSAVRVAARWSMPSNAAPSDSALSRALGHGYALFGRALKPLFYLNRNYWGEQLLLVARRRAA